MILVAHILTGVFLGLLSAALLGGLLQERRHTRYRSSLRKLRKRVAVC